MKRVMTSLLALAMITSVSFADDSATGKKSCCADKAGGTCALEGAACSGGGCPMEAALAKLPKMTYLVGTESTCCDQSAAKLAEEHDAPIQFVAMNKTFDDKNKAMLALAEETEQFVAEFASTHKCEASGTLTVAGKQMSCSVMAGQRAKIAKQAMDSVDMTYLVGTKSCSCPMEAASLAKTSGTEKKFVIGEETTCCSVDARVRLAQAKYKAAVAALAKADAPAQTEESANL